MISKIKKMIIRHKFITALIITAIVAGGYWEYKRLGSSSAQTQYVLATVEKGTLVVSVSGSGQVSASDQIDIKPKTSGDLIYIGVKNGQEVKAGSLLFKIDASDAQRALQDAGINLESAQIKLDELLEPPDELTLLQSENSLAKARQSKQEALDNIEQGYEDALGAVTDVFFDLPTIMSGLNNIMYSESIGKSEAICAKVANKYCLVNSIRSIDYDKREEQKKFTDIVDANYQTARAKYDKNFTDYKNISHYSEQSDIEALLDETADTLKAAAELTKSEINAIDFWIDYQLQNNFRVFSSITQYQSDLKSYTSKINSYLANLLKIQKSFENNRQAVVDADYSVKERELSLENLKEGADDLDIRSAKLSIQQKEQALSVAKDNLANCFITARFEGIITAINSKVKIGDSVSSGTSLATLLTSQRIAEITLNEVDAAKVVTGQKVTLAFDAVEELNITGDVAEIDTLGTVSQGVVTYNVKIVFDTQDDRVKPGMSVSAMIITDVRQDVLLIPVSAVKFSGEENYVEILNSANSPVQQTVQIGSSNDSYSEVTGGLKEGDKVISRTITGNTVTQTRTQSSSGFQIPGTGGFGR